MKDIKTIVCVLLSFALVFLSGAIFAQQHIVIKAPHEGLLPRLLAVSSG